MRQSRAFYFAKFLLYLVGMALLLSTCSCSSMKHGGRDYKGMKGVNEYPKYGHFTILIYFGFNDHFTVKQ